MKSQESRTRRNSRDRPAELVFCLKATYGRTLAIKSEHILRGIDDAVKLFLPIWQVLNCQLNYLRKPRNNR
jgi:hypothetical protein